MQQQSSSHKHQNSQQNNEVSKVTASKGYMGINISSSASKYGNLNLRYIYTNVAFQFGGGTSSTKFGNRKHSQPCIKVAAFSKTSGRLFSAQNQKLQSKGGFDRAHSNSPQQTRSNKFHNQQQQQQQQFQLQQQQQQKQQQQHYYANHRNNVERNYSDVKQPKYSTVKNFIPSNNVAQQRRKPSKKLELLKNQQFSPNHYQIAPSNIKKAKQGNYVNPSDSLNSKKFNKSSNKNDSMAGTSQSNIDISNTASKRATQYLSSSQHNSKPIINSKSRKTSLSNYPSNYGGRAISSRTSKKAMTDVLMKVTSPNNFQSGRQKFGSPSDGGRVGGGGGAGGDEDYYNNSQKSKIKKAKQTYFSNQRCSEPFLATGLKMHFPGSITNMMQIDLGNGARGAGEGAESNLTPGSAQRLNNNKNFQKSGVYKDASSLMNRSGNHHHQQQQQQQQRTPSTNANFVFNQFRVGNDSSRNNKHIQNNSKQDVSSKPLNLQKTKIKRNKKGSSNTIFLPNNFGTLSPNYHRNKTPPSESLTCKKNDKRGRSDYSRTSTQNFEIGADGKFVRQLNIQVHQLMEQKEKLVSQLKKKDIQIQNLISTKQNNPNSSATINRIEIEDGYGQRHSPKEKIYLKNAPNSFIRLNKNPEITPTGQEFQFYKNQASPSRQSKLNDGKITESQWHSSDNYEESNRFNQPQSIKKAPKTDVRNHHYHQYQEQFDQNTKRYVVRKMTSPENEIQYQQDGSIQSEKITKSLRKYHNNKKMGATGEMWPSTTTNESRLHGKRKIQEKKATTGQYSASISGAKTSSIGISNGGILTGQKEIQFQIKEDKNELDNMKGRVFTVLTRYQQRVKDLRNKVQILQRQNKALKRQQQQQQHQQRSSSSRQRNN